MAPKIPINVKHNLEDIDQLRDEMLREARAALSLVEQSQEWAAEQHDTPNLLRLSQLNRQLTRITSRLNKVERKILDGLDNCYRSDTEPKD